MPRRPYRLTLALVGALVLLVVPVTGAGAAPSTTGTELVIPLRATLMKSGGIHLSASPRVDLETTILFLVTNRSSKPRWFEIGTRKTTLRRTPLIRPGATDRFYYVFRMRGKVPFRYGGPGIVARSGAFRVV